MRYKFFFYSILSLFSAAIAILSLAFIAAMIGSMLLQSSRPALAEKNNTSGFEQYARLIKPGDEMKLIVSISSTGPSSYTVRYEYADKK
jgi:hypothetical protein